LSHPAAAGLVLSLAACMPVMAILVVAPVLPQIETAFADLADVKALAPIALTVPALMIAISAWTMGWIADRVGRKRLLLIAMALYALFGMAPLFLDTLPAIILSRALTGITEAAIITVATVLVGDYYVDGERERYLALQIGLAGVAAIFFLAVGGTLGEHGWRTPFWLYGISVILVVPLALVLFEPTPTDRPMPAAAAVGTNFPLATISGICVITLFAATCFYLPIVQNGFLLNAIGIRSPETIGLVGAAGAAANLAGTAGFVGLARFGTHRLLALSFALMGTGLLILSMATALPVFVAGGIISALGGGIVLPTLVNWALSRLRFHERGRGIGLWQAAFWLGQFASPVIVLAIIPLVGGLAAAVGLFGAAALLFTLLWLAFGGGARWRPGTV
jgi:MFS family permease